MDFGSNADEMRDAYDLFHNSVIRPFQNILLEGLRPILAASSITLPLEFKPLQPAGFLDLNHEEPRVEERVEERVFSEEPKQISLEDSDKWLMHLSDKHSPMSKGWKLWRTEEVTDTSEDKWLHDLGRYRAFSESPSTLNPYANYSESSEWDVISPKGHLFAVRYKYAETAKTPPVDPDYESRDFCTAMMSMSDAGAMFRYDDILTMSMDGVNGNFAPSGESQYDILEWGVPWHPWNPSKSATEIHYKNIRMVFLSITHDIITYI